MVESVSKGKIALIVICCLLAVIIGYVAVCCGITFIPMLKMMKVNEVACGEQPQLQEPVTLENDVKLYPFPSGGKKDKYVVICPGGGYTSCALETEGFPIAAEFNKMGYTAFVLEYRVGERINSAMAPIEDLVNAIRYVDENAQMYNVYAGLYVLCGFSAGGNLVGMFGTDRWGYGYYQGIKKPNAIIMGYPWSNPHLPSSYGEGGAKGLIDSTINDYNGNIADAVFYSSLAKRGAEAFLGNTEDIEEMQLQRWITDDYPRTFIMHGDSDVIVPVEESSDLLVEALEEKGVDHRYKKCEGIGHGCGLGIGTCAEGWLAEAMEFANEKWYEEEYTPDPLSCEELLEKAGGFLCGICHPDYKVAEAKELGAEWVRVDLSVPPFLKDGTYSPIYGYFKDMLKSYADQGLKVLAVTPFSDTYVQLGMDPREKENIPIIMNQLRYMVEDLQGIVSAIQVMNELNEPQFRSPLTLEESVEFLGMQLKVLNRYKGDIIVGYNLSATDFQLLLELAEPYNGYTDYIGIDFYLGCFESMTRTLGFAPVAAWLDYIKKCYGRPIIVTEFGYLSAGERMSSEEKLALLHNYGAQGDTVSAAEAYAKAHIKEFIENANFPYKLRERLETICKKEDRVTVDYELIAKILFGGGDVTISYAAHLYMELEEGILIDGYPHTPEGQADYFRDCFDAMLGCRASDYLCGTFVYCFNDSASCYVCGQENCPVETGWGLLDGEGNKKPSFYSVKEAFEKCKER